MTLAEALIERADLKARIEQITSRMKENALVEEGETPTEEVGTLKSAYESMMGTLETLITRINNTNNTAKIEDMTIAEAIIKRDCLKSKISAYCALREAASSNSRRYLREGVKYVRTVDIKKLQKQIDTYAQQYRELDTKIQRQNWLVELL